MIDLFIITTVAVIVRKFTLQKKKNNLQTNRCCHKWNSSC